MKEIKVVAAVICDGEQVFATQRGYGDYKGWWEFPGGKIEPGESPQEALKREIREEMAAEITVGKLIDVVEYDYPQFHLSMQCFWCSLMGDDFKLLEAEDARWLGFDELYSVNWLPADYGLIEKIKRDWNSKAGLKGECLMKKETIDRILRFTIDRDWDQFHTPANLAKSISIEANELLECFQWGDDNYKLEDVRDELADVLVYCIDMLDKLGLDADEIINAKMDKNEKKYPAEKAKGNAKKYTEL